MRAAEVADARAIAEIHVESWRAAYVTILAPEQLDRLNADDRAQAWRDRIPRTGGEGFRTWVAHDGDKLVGFAFTRPTEDDDLNPLEIGELTALYVVPSAFGTGIGVALLGRAVGGLRSQGFLHAVLWVLEENTRAIHFYRREGWRPDGTRAACFRVFGAPAVRFRLPL